MNLRRLSHFIVAFPLFIVGVFISTTAASQFKLTDPVPFDKNIKVGELENGLKYFILKNQKPENRVELRLAVNAGSMMEDEDQQGLAHFVEHMCFNGTKHFKKNELINYLESIGAKFGAHLNAYTSFDETVYKLNVPTDSTEIISKAFQILRDWAGDVSFESEEIDKERGVVVEEWRTGQDAGERMREKFWPVLFHDSRYSVRLPIGKKEIIENFKHDRARQFYKDWYRPNLMAVMVVGDIDVEKMEEKIKVLFSTLTNPKKVRQRKSYEVPNHKDPLVSIVSDKEAQYSIAQLMYKQKPFNIKSIGDFRKAILHSLYNQMIKDRLNEYTQKANPPFVYASSGYQSFIRTKDIYSSVSVGQIEKIKEGLEVLLTENERVKRFGFTESELERAKKDTESSLDRQFKEKNKTQSSKHIDQLVAHFLEEGIVPSMEDQLVIYEQLLPTIKKEELNALAKKWVTNENLVAIIQAPEKEGGVLPTKQEIIDLIKVVRTKKIDPYVDEVSKEPLFGYEVTPGKVIKQEKIEQIGVNKWELANGAKIVLKSTDFKEDEILLKGLSWGGVAQYPESDDMSASEASAVINESGLGDFNEVVLGKQLAGKTVAVSTSINEQQEIVRGSSSVKDFEAMLQLVNMYFVHPRKDEEAFQAYKSQLELYLDNKDSDPTTAFRDTITTTLAQHHPRRRPFSQALMNELKLDRMHQIYKKQYANAADFTFTFVGNIALDQAQPLIEKYIGSLPSTKEKEQPNDLKIRYPKGVITKVVKKGIEPKAQVNIAFTGDYKWSKQESWIIKGMINVLKIRLREQLREDKGGVYGVGVYPSYSRVPHQDYKMTIGFTCSPENSDDLINTVFNEIKKVQTEGPGMENLKKTVETFKREQEINNKKNGYWLSVLSSASLYGDALNAHQNNLEYINEMDAKKLQEATKKYFNFENYVVVKLLPIEK